MPEGGGWTHATVTDSHMFIADVLVMALVKVTRSLKRIRNV